MKSEVRVFAPATVANVSCAFDILGFPVSSPGDEIFVKLTENPGIKIKEIHGDQGKLSLDPLRNTAGVAVAAFLRHLGSNQGVELELFKQMPLGSGLGSSAASAVAAAYAVNQLFDSPLSKQELLPFVLEAEKMACGSAHADNVAPALLGGFVLIRSYEPLDVIKLPTPAELHCALVHPKIEIRTEDARKILKRDIQLKDAVKQWGNIAGLIAALYNEDYSLLQRSLQDHIIEPVRSLLIPGFENIKSLAISAGALGCGISGSGPSIFALARGLSQAQSIAETMLTGFQQLEVDATSYVSKINLDGPRIISVS